MNEQSFGEMMKNIVITGQQLTCMYQTKLKKDIILKMLSFYFANYRLYIPVQIKHNKEEIPV